VAGAVLVVMGVPAGHGLPGVAPVHVMPLTCPLLPLGLVRQRLRCQAGDGLVNLLGALEDDGVTKRSGL
jgi:hypothetical protein